ncbi:MAG: hypothetical protein ACMXYG_04205 [Candidatus Woesearchaeota archaeon]
MKNRFIYIKKRFVIISFLILLLSIIYVSAGWVTVFYDDFTSPVLDLNNWVSDPREGSIVVHDSYDVVELTAPYGKKFPRLHNVNPLPMSNRLKATVSMQYSDVRGNGAGFVFHGPCGELVGLVWQDVGINNQLFIQVYPGGLWANQFNQRGLGQNNMNWYGYNLEIFNQSYRMNHAGPDWFSVSENTYTGCNQPTQNPHIILGHHIGYASDSHNHHWPVINYNFVQVECYATDEVCDGWDNDCDGIIDNAPGSTVSGSACWKCSSSWPASQTGKWINEGSPTSIDQSWQPSSSQEPEGDCRWGCLPGYTRVGNDCVANFCASDGPTSSSSRWINFGSPSNLNQAWVYVDSNDKVTNSCRWGCREGYIRQPGTYNCIAQCFNDYDGLTYSQGQTAPCYTGNKDLVGTGICINGTYTCQSDSSWSSCLGQVLPQVEQCGSGEDESCSGYSDWDTQIWPVTFFPGTIKTSGLLHTRLGIKGDSDCRVSIRGIKLII